MSAATAPGYSGTPLVQKLGIKPAWQVALVDAPAGYEELIQPLPSDVAFSKTPTSSTDLVHVFATQARDLAKQLTAWRAKLKPEAVVWVSWPKKASKVATTLTEDTIREIALPLGFVDVKVCAVTEVWSGLKLVVRKELR